MYPRAFTDEDWMKNVDASALEGQEVFTWQLRVPRLKPKALPPFIPFLPPGVTQAITYGAGLLGSYTFTQSLAGTQPLTQSSSTRPLPAVPIVQSQQPTNGIAWPPHMYGCASSNSV